MSFVTKIRAITHKLIKILESYDNLINNEEVIGFESPKYNLISMCSNILNNNNIFFHKIFEEFIIFKK